MKFVPIVLEPEAAKEVAVWVGDFGKLNLDETIKLLFDQYPMQSTHIKRVTKCSSG